MVLKFESYSIDEAIEVINNELNPSCRFTSKNLSKAKIQLCFSKKAFHKPELTFVEFIQACNLTESPQGRSIVTPNEKSKPYVERKFTGTDKKIYPVLRKDISSCILDSDENHTVRINRFDAYDSEGGFHERLSICKEIHVEKDGSDYAEWFNKNCVAAPEYLEPENYQLYYTPAIFGAIPQLISVNRNDLLVPRAELERHIDQEKQEILNTNNSDAAKIKHKEDFKFAKKTILPTFEKLLSEELQLHDTKGKILEKNSWTAAAFIRLCDKENTGYGSKMITKVYKYLKNEYDL